MSAVTVKKVHRPPLAMQKSSEATWRPSTGLKPQAIAIETEHLSRTVADRVLVSDITVQVQPGEVLAVVGPSGGGASRPSCGC